jgi:uncharacterized protein YjbJ (UPF0337 family)
MGLGDKIQNVSEEAAGKVKEAAGRATDNQIREADGEADQASANMKQAGERARTRQDGGLITERFGRPAWWQQGLPMNAPKV